MVRGTHKLANCRLLRRIARRAAISSVSAAAASLLQREQHCWSSSTRAVWSVRSREQASQHRRRPRRDSSRRQRLARTPIDTQLTIIAPRRHVQPVDRDEAPLMSLMNDHSGNNSHHRNSSSSSRVYETATVMIISAQPHAGYLIQNANSSHADTSRC